MAPCRHHLQDSAAVWGLLGLQLCPSPTCPSFIPPLFALPLLNSLADPTSLHPKQQHSIRVRRTGSLPCWQCSLTTAQIHTNPWESQWHFPGGFPTVWQPPLSCRAAAVHCVTTRTRGQHWDGHCTQSSAASAFPPHKVISMPTSSTFWKEIGQH